MKKVTEFILMLLVFSVAMTTVSAIISKTVHKFIVFWDEETFHVIVESTSTVSDFYFSQPLMQIGFKISGSDGTFGFSNVTIPRALLWVDKSFEWEVLMDGHRLSPIIFFNGTHTRFYLSYYHSTHQIKISGTHTVGPTPERRVGVEVGDWAKYNSTLNYTTNDPHPPTPPSPQMSDIEYFKIEVLSTTDTEVSFSAAIHFFNGTKTSSNYTTDVSSGHQSTFYYFIGANLSAGERIYLTPYSIRINSTILRTYADMEREVNFARQKYNSTAFPNYRVVGEFCGYWDKATGIFDELLLRQRYTESTEGYVTEVIIHMVMKETSIWKKERQILGSGWGWLKVGPRKSIFGRAEIYKNGDNQIGITIFCHGKEYSQTWTIIRHLQRRNHEYYFCRNQKAGVLIVKLQYGRSPRGLAVGRSAIAFCLLG